MSATLASAAVSIISAAFLCGAIILIHGLFTAPTWEEDEQ